MNWPLRIFDLISFFPHGKPDCQIEARAVRSRSISVGINLSVEGFMPIPLLSSVFIATTTFSAPICVSYVSCPLNWYSPEELSTHNQGPEITARNGR
jgi:hypothetical protein